MSEPSVFIVRVWRGAAPFRAAVRAVEVDETLAFSDPAELLRFLERGAPQPLRADAPANAAPAPPVLPKQR